MVLAFFKARAIPIKCIQKRPSALLLGRQLLVVYGGDGYEMIEYSDFTDRRQSPGEGIEQADEKSRYSQVGIDGHVWCEQAQNVLNDLKASPNALFIEIV